MAEERICSICDELIDDEEEFFTLEDGSVVCESCYDNYTEECAMCGRRFHDDDMTYWGDVRICYECLEDQCPSFDEKENEDKTQEAYEAFYAKYVGRYVVEQSSGIVNLETTVGDETPICYTISVKIDENGMISDVSRLKASMLLSESERNSDWRPYPVEKDDYDFWAEDLLEDNLEFEE